MNWNIADKIKPEDYKRVLICEYFTGWDASYQEAYYSSESGKWYDKHGDDEFGNVRFWCELPDKSSLLT